jgi:putative acetyltransferase
MSAAIRAERAADAAAVREVVIAAFGRDDEARLVTALHAGSHVRVARVAETQGAVVGHVLLSRLVIRAAHGVVEALALAPLSVAPARRHRGIGTALVRDALGTARAHGHGIVVVLGEPAYYGRFGFAADRAASLAAPFPRHAFQALELIAGALAGVAGPVEYPPPFGVSP